MREAEPRSRRTLRQARVPRARCGPRRDRACWRPQAARPTSLHPSPTSTAGTASASSSPSRRTSSTSPRSCSPPIHDRSARRSSITGASSTQTRSSTSTPTSSRSSSSVREAAGRYLRTSPDEIALTDSTTMGLGLMYRGLRLSPGDEIVTTEHDFYATHVSLRAAATRSGAAIRFVRLYDDPATATRGRIVDSIARALTPRTRCLAVTWVHSSTGVRAPPRRDRRRRACGEPGIGPSPSARSGSRGWGACVRRGRDVAVKIFREEYLFYTYTIFLS